MMRKKEKEKGERKFRDRGNFESPEKGNIKSGEMWMMMLINRETIQRLKKNETIRMLVIPEEVHLVSKLFIVLFSSVNQLGNGRMIVRDCSIFSLVVLVLWNDVNYDVRGYSCREREK